VLNIFTKNIHCTEGLTIFLKMIQDKNLKYSLRSYELFLDIIEEIDTEKLKEGIKWEPVLKELMEISKMEKNPYPKRFKSIFTILQKKLGTEFFEIMLNDMLDLEDYLYFSKTEMINFNELSIKLIREEQEINENSKQKKTIQEHIKDEKLENDLLLAQEEEKEAKTLKENLESKEKTEVKSSKKIPELVLTSAVKTIEKQNSVLNSKAKSEIIEVEKSASGSKVIENGSILVIKLESAKKEIVIEENPLRNCSSIKKNSPAMTGSKNMDKIENEERAKGTVEVDLLKSSAAKLKDQENIIN